MQHQNKVMYFRLNEEIEAMVAQIYKQDKGKFNNKSHVVRVAIIRLFLEQNQLIKKRL